MYSSRLQTICLAIFSGFALYFFVSARSTGTVTAESNRRIAMVMLQVPKNPTSFEDPAVPKEDDPLARAYESCIQNHVDYCARHGYPLIIERKNISGRLAYWQKILSLSRIMYDAIENDTHDWLFWTDSDTLILNDDIELESFLPPNWPELQDEEDQVHVLMARDHRGWNNGVFFIRVHPWSLAYLLRTYTWPDYHPSFRSFEQSAMARLYEDFEDVRRHVVHVPMKWFNAYPSGKSVYNARPNDFQMHFPGDTNKDTMIQRALSSDKREALMSEDSRKGMGPAHNRMTIDEFWSEIASNKSSRGQIYPHQ